MQETHNCRRKMNPLCFSCVFIVFVLLINFNGVHVDGAVDHGLITDACKKPVEESSVRRLDKYIDHMSYVPPEGFRILASNYLSIDKHHLFGEIEELIQESQTTPAEVVDELMASDDADVSLNGLVQFLKRKVLEAKQLKEEEEEAQKALKEETDQNETNDEERKCKDPEAGQYVGIHSHGAELTLSGPLNVINDDECKDPEAAGPYIRIYSPYIEEMEVTVTDVPVKWGWKGRRE